MSPRRLIEENPLSIEARLLRAGRSMEPSEASYGKLIASLGTAGATFGVGSASAAKLGFGSSLMGIAAKGVAVGALVGASVLAAAQVQSAWQTRGDAPPATSLVAGRRSNTSKRASAVDTPLLEARPAQELTGRSPDPTAVRSAPLGFVPPSERAESKASLGAEVALLDRIRRALDEAQPAIALDLLGQHERLFPAPRLGEESSYLRIRALKVLGRTAEAEQAMGRFRQRYPNSALP